MKHPCGMRGPAYLAAVVAALKPERKETMSVRAKMVLTEVTDLQWGGKRLRFTAQYDTTIPEDQRFQKATPSASAEFHIDNPAALEQFRLGEAYYLDFVPAAVPA